MNVNSIAAVLLSTVLSGLAVAQTTTAKSARSG